MVMFMFFDDRLHRELRRNRVFRDRTHPLEVWNEDEITRTVRFPQEEVTRLTGGLIEDIECGLPSDEALTPVLQVLALRYNATSIFQNMVADLKDV